MITHCNVCRTDIRHEEKLTYCPQCNAYWDSKQNHKESVDRLEISNELSENEINNATSFD